MAAVANGHALGFLDDEFFGGFTGVFGFVGTVAIGFVGGFAAGAVMFYSRSFICIVG